MIKKTLTLEDIKNIIDQISEKKGKAIDFLGEGRGIPYTGNETTICNIQTPTIRELQKIILGKFPGHNPKTFDGHCLYRTRIPENQNQSLS